MSGFPHNEVERSLAEAAAGRVSVEEWLSVFVHALVWVPMTATSGQQGTFPVLSIDGGSYVPVFTSEAEVDRAAPDNPRIASVVRTWMVAYFERGSYRDVRVFDTEHEACVDFLEMLG